MEIKGISVSYGKVIGSVRIFNKQEDFASFLQGEILVVSQSKADIVHLIPKAAAVICDEGGMMSHAAVLSREFKKPCIIGTKIATQILKDGDMVEVDANKGIVRIIK